MPSNRMSAATFLWLTVLSTGLAATVATWTCLNSCVHGIISKRALTKLWVRDVAASKSSLSIELLGCFSACVGIVLALKATWDGKIFFAACLIFAGLLLIEPLCTWLSARKMFDITPVLDLTFICLEQGGGEMSILQRLDTASSTQADAQLRGIVEKMLQDYREGATEEEAIQKMLLQNRNHVWQLLIWTLLAPVSEGDHEKLRNNLGRMMQRKLALAHRARMAMQSTRRSLGFVLFLCAAVTTSLTFSREFGFFVNSLHAQVLSSLVLLSSVWAASIWSTQIRTLQRMME